MQPIRRAPFHRPLPPARRCAPRSLQALPLLLLFGALTDCARATGTTAFGDRAREARDQAFASAAAFATHTWRDTPTFPGGGTVNAYVEIPLGERTKYEFRIDRNDRAIDRVLRDEIGGYPVNYGMIPGTVAFDGDPLDILVLGPKLAGGTVLAVEVVGLMQMDDEKGADPKIVARPVSTLGAGVPALDAATKSTFERFFNGYKRFEADKGKWSKVTGWSTVTDARRLIERCRSFFESGR